MLKDPTRIAGPVDHVTFHSGEGIILAEGPHKYVRGVFLNLKADVKWASIKEPNGAVNSHPVEWMRCDHEPGSSTWSKRELRRSNLNA
jgi:hypothetical protein